MEPARLTPFAVLAVVAAIAVLVRIVGLLPAATPPAGEPPAGSAATLALTPDPARWEELIAREPAAGDAQDGGKQDGGAAVAEGDTSGNGPAAAEAADPGLMQQALAEIRAQREALQRRTEEVELRETVLATSEEQLRKLIAQLEAAKTAVQGLLEQRSKEEEARLAQLVKVYETMKAKRAAQVFDGMPLAELMPLIRRMADRKVASILQEMSADRARELTAALTRPRELPPLDSIGGG